MERLSIRCWESRARVGNGHSSRCNILCEHYTGMDNLFVHQLLGG